MASWVYLVCGGAPSTGGGLLPTKSCTSQKRGRPGSISNSPPNGAYGPGGGHGGHPHFGPPFGPSLGGSPVGGVGLHAPLKLAGPSSPPGGRGGPFFGPPCLGPGPREGG